MAKEKSKAYKLSPSPITLRSISVKELNPAPYNPRKKLTESDPEYIKIRNSIEKFNMVTPIVWNKRTGNVVGGHQRLQVLIDKGFEEVEVSVVDLEENEEKALNLALNKVGGAWDELKLSEIFKGLSQLEDFDLSVTGFDLDEIDILSSGREIDIDKFLSDTDRGVEDKGPKIITCPECGEEIEL